MVSKVFEHPFDLTKVRLQAQVLDSTARFNGPIDCLRQTWTKEGLRGLYRVCRRWLSLELLMPTSLQGLPAPIVGAMAENASLFLSYNELQQLIRRLSGQPHDASPSLSQVAIAAAGAGGITATLLYVTTSVVHHILSWSTRITGPLSNSLNARCKSKCSPSRPLPRPPHSSHPPLPLR
jgi:mitochondrial ornithine carrier protein